jgi:hypothetical protein
LTVLEVQAARQVGILSDLFRALCPMETCQVLECVAHPKSARHARYVGAAGRQDSRNGDAGRGSLQRGVSQLVAGQGTVTNETLFPQQALQASDGRGRVRIGRRVHAAAEVRHVGHVLRILLQLAGVLLVPLLKSLHFAAEAVVLRGDRSGVRAV